MKKHLVKIILMTVLLALFVPLLQGTVYAAEGAVGQVTRSGTISFYEDSTTEPSRSEPSKSSSTEESVKKPTGRLPNTGEQIRKASTIFGALLILFILVLFFLRKRREEDQK